MLRAVGGLAVTRLLLLVFLPNRELLLAAGSAAFLVLGAFALRFFADVEAALLLFTASDEADPAGAANEPIPCQSRQSNNADVCNNDFLSKISSRSNESACAGRRPPTLQTAKAHTMTLRLPRAFCRSRACAGIITGTSDHRFPHCGCASFPADWVASSRAKDAHCPSPARHIDLSLTG